MFKMVVDKHPPLPEGISIECKDFLLKCFEKEPSLRIDAVGLLQHKFIKQTQSTEVSDYNDFPEEVTNTIKLHIDKTEETSPVRKTDQRFQKIKHNLLKQEEVDYNQEFGISSFVQLRESINNMPSHRLPPGSFVGTLKSQFDSSDKR